MLFIYKNYAFDLMNFGNSDFKVHFSLISVCAMGDDCSLIKF